MARTRAHEEVGDEEIRERILLQTVTSAAFDGWTLQALRTGAEAAGRTAADAARLFPGGIMEVVEAFSAWADDAMLQAMDVADLDSMKVRERVAFGVRARLQALQPYQEAVRRLMSLLALPVHAPLAGRLTFRTVDAIWYAAGDTATDFNYYTKRGLLAAVYGATVLYWLADRSEGSADSWAFLDRRIGDVMGIGKALSGRGVGRLARHLPSPMRFARQMRRNAFDRS